MCSVKEDCGLVLVQPGMVRKRRHMEFHSPNTSERLRRLDEASQIILKMWTQERTTFVGQYYRVKEAYCNPKAVQKPHPPLLIGGDGERETLKIVAKYADACNLSGSTSTIKRRLSILREHCKNVGRNYDSILKTKI